MKSIWEKFKIYGPRKFFSYAAWEFYYRFWQQLVRRSYSQRGEDLILDKLLGYPVKGLYMDVGANDPVRFSNTKRFYDRGWNGINIEPDKDLHEGLVKARPKDTNLNIGIGEQPSTLTFFRFLPDTLSTFSKEEADDYIAQGYKLLGTSQIDVLPLAKVLDDNLQGRQIDFLSVDTEGFDMQVMRSNNWEKYRPKAICIESVTHTMDGKDNVKEDNHEDFLLKVGYRKAYDNGLNSIYLDGNNSVKEDNFEKAQGQYFDSYSKREMADELYKSCPATEYEYQTITNAMGDLTGKKILDVGCGVGRFSFHLCQRAAEVVGVDISERSIAKANEQAQEKGLTNFKGLVHNFKTPLQENYFDYVVMVNVIHHVEDIESVLKSIRLTLNGQGRLIIFEFNPLNFLFIPFLAMIRQMKSHFNRQYLRSNIFRLQNILAENGFCIKARKKYAFLPTALYNYSRFFISLNNFLNAIPLINVFSAFHILVCEKKEKAN